MHTDPSEQWCARQRGPVAESLLALGLPDCRSMSATARYASR
ncbi:hypothetical protein I551_4672 [Mycobacterium ulcerans str. Harvey]|uniref:Uncharacterized protein n=1 Tax=Mycobacterium ulcerans str. Harvey TaxID=1299332 RepID=A0ABN0QVX4_MYCUL|nr:hypothetical protein I551_4672 [Mycobacterium ulcerans str. Harvey]